MQPHRYSEILDALASIALFAGVPERHLAELARTTRRTSYGKGQIIFHPGDAARELFFLLSGQVKRSTFSVGGNERVLELLTPGSHFAEAEVFGPQIHGSLAVAVAPTTLLCVGAEGLRRVVEAVPALALRFLAALAGRTIAIENDASTRHFRTGCQRVLDYLLAQVGAPLAAAGETILTLPTSKQLIASRIGITPETLSRVLRDLSNAGMIVVAGRDIRLQNACINQRLAEATREQAVFPRRHTPRDGSGAASRRRKLVAAPTTPGAAINMAGRQRMLSQRMAKAWLLLGQDILPQRSRGLLAQSAALFDEQLAALAMAAFTDDVRHAHVEVAAIWKRYQALLARTPEPRAARELFRLNETLLAAAHEMTEAFERAGALPHGHWINLAGRQRMLSQRVAKFYLFERWGVHTARSREGRAEAMQEFTLAQAKLATPAGAAPAIAHQLERVSQHWLTLTSALDGMDGGDEKRRAALVATTSERLLREMDAAVGLCERLAC